MNQNNKRLLPQPVVFKSRHFSFLGRNSQRAFRQGFTLFEMLIVITIMVLLTVVAAPSVFGPSSSGRMNENLSDLNGILEDARQYALAQNTYVWVAFAPQTDSTGMKTLSVAILISADGTDPAAPATWTGYSYGAVPNAQFKLASKIITLRQVSLSAAGTFTASQIPNLPPITPAVSGTANSMPTLGTGYFNLQLPGSSTPQAFTMALQFTPTGEVRNGINPVDLVELDLQPQLGNSAQLDQKNVAAIRINGITGESEVYRP